MLSHFRRESLKFTAVLPGTRDRVGRQSSGGFDAHANPVPSPDRHRAAWRNPRGTCSIADKLSVVRQKLQNGEFINILLFHQPCAVHDDDFRNWRLLLRKPVLSRADGACRQSSVRSRRVRRLGETAELGSSRYSAANWSGARATRAARCAPAESPISPMRSGSRPSSAALARTNWIAAFRS
jgi:hypothetical protein